MRVDGSVDLLVAVATDGGVVVDGGGAELEAVASDLVLAFARFAHVHSERDARAHEHAAEAAELVLGERVHRIDEDGDDPRGSLLVAELQATADDWVEERLGLARSGAGGDERRLTAEDRPDRGFLVGVDLLVWGEVAEIGVEELLPHEGVDRRSLLEGAGEFYVRTF